MKAKRLLPFLLLLAAAGLAGWFLPVLAAKGYDHSTEGKAETVDIRQIDISYQSDLSIADRLRLIREHNTVSERIPLEHGIQLTDQEAKTIAESFLQTLTGTSGKLEAWNYSLDPELLSFEQEGSFLVWNVTVFWNGSWTCEMVLDDQTGLLLRCVLRNEEGIWENLFHGLDGASDGRTFIRSALENALLSHCRLRLSTDFTLSEALEDIDQDGFIGSFLFTGDGVEPFEMSVLLVLFYGELSINP